MLLCREPRVGNVDPTTIPYGYCLCGCGARTPLAPITSSRAGWVKGEPLRYAATGHQNRRLVQYIETDCGFASACWLWQLSTAHGYGRYDVDGQNRTAHVVY